MYTGPPCTPTIFNHGKSTTVHDNEAGSEYWAVFRGRIPGIYLEHGQAQDQTYGFRNMSWRAFPTLAEALSFWNAQCATDHKHASCKVRGIQRSLSFGVWLSRQETSAQKGNSSTPPGSFNCSSPASRFKRSVAACRNNAKVATGSRRNVLAAFEWRLTRCSWAKTRGSGLKSLEDDEQP
ncbi:hypothetical protein C8R44DRAFT_723636 [Mycena epipterygia]|nr:hypothetical protein C8R44DRAFT_736058 [Mycena epipterygia]KAJ7145716.1 hypothetical protein C8R44DRAFT_723636 [Mycena epipterygia]